MTRSIAIFWDYENCRPSPNLPGNKLIGNIRRLVQPLEPIKSFKAYVDLSSEISNPRYATLHSELQSSGVALVHCPHEGRKDVADKMMIVDMLTFAMDNPPPATIVIITGDRDFAYAAAVLKLRGYKIIVIAPSSAASLGLKLQADDLFDWQKDVTGIDETDGIGDSGVFVSPEAEISIEGEKLDERDLKRSFLSPLNVPPTSSSPSLARSTERSTKPSDPLRAAEPQVFESAQTSVRNTDSVLDLSTSGMSRGEDSVKSAIAATPPCAKPPNSALDRDLTGAHSTVRESDEDDGDCTCTICTRSSGVFRSPHRATNKETNVAVCVSSPKMEPTSNRGNADPGSTTTTPSSVSSYISNATTTESPKQDVRAPTLQSIIRFLPLIKYFVAQRGIAGTTRIRASTVASALLNLNPTVYGDAGVSGLKQYIEEAKRANVVVTPGLDSEGDGWIEINSALYCNSSHNTSPTGQALLQRIIAATSTIARFQPLITAFMQQRDISGTRQLRASIVASAMLKKDPKVYKKAGVTGMKQYIEEARQADILLAPQKKNGDIWVEINPKLLSDPEQFFLKEQSTGQQTRSEKPKPSKLTVDAVFKPLVERLQAESPSYRMTYGTLGTFFKEKYPNLCKLAGVSRIKKYVEKAQEKGLVTILDDEWFQLVPALRHV